MGDYVSPVLWTSVRRRSSSLLLKPVLPGLIYSAQAKVSQFEDSSSFYQNIFGFDVTVNQIPLLGEYERTATLVKDNENLVFIKMISLALHNFDLLV